MITSIGYNPKKNVLEIEFNSGALWQYSDVEKSIFNKMMKADSPGRFFLDNILDCYCEIQMRRYTQATIKPFKPFTISFQG